MRTPRVFFGWWVVFAFATMIFFTTGIRLTVGPFLKPVTADLHLDRAAFSLVIALNLFLYGAFQPFVGRAVERIGARPVTVIGILVLGAAAAATGFVTRLWHFYLTFGVAAAVGLAATGHVVASAVLARWFTRHRATALTAMGAASMAGMSLLVPVATGLIITIGWRATYVAFGVAVVVVLLPLALWVVRESPESMGLTSDGLPPGAAAPAAPARETTGVGAAIQTSTFWQLGGVNFTCGFSMSLLAAHGVPMLTDHGYHPMVASGALGLLGASSVVFAILSGAVADRFGRKPILAWLYGGRGLLFAAMFLIQDSPALLLVVMVLGGATLAGSLGLTAALSADIFGRYSVGSVFGSIFVVHQVGMALGSWLSGFLFEVAGGYGAAFTAASLLLALAAVVSLTIDERARWIAQPASLARSR